MNQRTPVQPPGLEAIADMFAALGHAGRLTIVRELLRAHPDGLVVGEIQGRLGLPGSTLSHHLDALRQAGIVESMREAKNIRYRVRVSGLREVMRFLSTECCSDTRVIPIEDLVKQMPRTRRIR